MALGDAGLSTLIEEYKTIEELTTERIRRAVVSGELKPGERIRQYLLADQLGVSRMPVRVALRRLSAEGLVTVERGVAMVSKLSADEAEEIYAMRLGLESLAARLGAEAMTPEVLETMRRELVELQAAMDDQDTARFIQHDNAFHLAHYQVAGRPGLLNKILDLWQRGERYSRVSTTLGHTMPLAMGAHRRILEACERRDGQAAQQATREYFDYASHAVLLGLRDSRV